VAGSGAAAGLAAWSLFEAQWVECRELEVGVESLPPGLDGLRVLHLSDFHAGTPSLNARSLRHAVDFGVRSDPDLVVVTGDLVSHPRGERAVVEQLARLRPPLGIYAVLGNHDCGATRDPWSRPHTISDWREAPVTLLRDSSALVHSDGLPALEIAGVDPMAWLEGRADPDALFRHPGATRVLLTHFPDVFDLASDRPLLALSGHLHGGQICLPDPRTPGRKVRLSKLRAPYSEGVFRRGARTMVVSRGVGTTLVPFRLLARPEAALLRLRRP
jgi:uncharacterized protein